MQVRILLFGEGPLQLRTHGEILIHHLKVIVEALVPLPFPSLDGPRTTKDTWGSTRVSGLLF